MMAFTRDWNGTTHAAYSSITPRPIRRTADNDANAFNVTATALTNTNITIGDNASRIAQTIPYQVTDPDGAYVIITTENVNTAASNQVVTASINWVQD